ncbi:helix-turn-helix and ligand-binding sensor domain-containing protein [Polaribacter sp. SA4-12]|uniref:helix-turn-helix and ligand-binding sensor domain-containing protein n=1 Tax=Polaribacter sp. SA4-12 TaxID=1312072 RepID=UPI000B3D4DD1|nr:triple tyrosine motif-containing protein [Polaribacter sp. SA4-12]ARV14433.1 LuxR family transcriptional regulator [Polaribacter sp. SA4-12]
MYRIIFLFLLISFSSIAQELPPIKTYTAKDYKAENQNWAISQSENKFIYVANNKGLLEFNGAIWQLYPTPNETIMRSVKVLGDKIYTGFYMDFGFWKKNDYGELVFNSIVKKQHIQMLEDEQIWSILEIDGWVLFKSLERIYLYNLETNEVKIINSEFRLYILSKVNDVIYFQEGNKGVFKIENGVPKLVSDHQILKENIIVEIFKKEGKLLFLTQKSGFFYLEGNELSKWETPSESILKNVTVYSAKLLKNNDYALGTISDGFIYLNSDGAVNYQITQGSGLNNNTLLSVFEDNDSNIWLGLDNGINCINSNSPFRIYNKKSDFIGTVYSSIVFEGNLYLGTNQGLFYRNNESKDSFKLIENTQGQVWSLDIIDNSLFCGHDSGTFLIDKNKSKLIFNKQGTWRLKQIDENKIIQGCYDGLYILEKKNNTWRLRNKIAGFNNSSKYFVNYDSNKFFVNHEYKGVFKLTLDQDYRKVVAISKEESLAKGLHSCLISYQDKILYSSKRGVFLYDKKKDVFIRDNIYSQLISEDNFISGELAFNKSNNMLWSFSKEDIKYLIPGKLSDKPTIKSIPVSASMPRATYGYENIIHIENEKYLIGTSNGYVLVNLNNLNGPGGFNVEINNVNNFIFDNPKTKVNLSLKKKFSSNENNFQFFYSVPNYNKITNIKYQYRLLGKSKQWSIPTDSNSVLFENVSYGSYTFKVRAIVGGEVSVNEAAFSFIIERPWYLSNTLITLYVILSLLAFYLVHIASKRYYKKQREELLEKAQKDSELKELESSQQIIKLNNDKLRSDIESKNRELATSTMNIIKKNDFLNTIKLELINGGDKSITSVVKIIDKNLNNTDDWKMFQEAFNNADKNFLKKVKDKHPGLTPNDLRLCAYLRLNLSSKEIAPLLNISPRSVEVKRYRLRKKMDLPHDSNLTNYILEI